MQSIRSPPPLCMCHMCRQFIAQPTKQPDRCEQETPHIEALHCYTVLQLHQYYCTLLLHVRGVCYI